jgi:Ca2+-dependent lipid-binding protein
MKWKAHHLLNTDSWFDWWDKSDPYLRFLKVRKDNTYVEAERTEVINNELNPNWKSLDIPLGKLIREDNLEQKFKVECWDLEEGGQAKHQFIG